MSEQPALFTARLVLRPFTLADAPVVQRLAGDRAVADTTELIPHPYEDGMAEKWISSHSQQFREQKCCNYAVVLKESGELIGAIGLTLVMQHHRGEIGYWIGRPFWGQGYCTEAAQALLEYGFGELGLRRIHGRCLSRNPASGRVMLKIGMQHEGCLRGHCLKWGIYEDAELYGLVRG